jgi:hypothetical protein
VDPTKTWGLEKKAVHCCTEEPACGSRADPVVSKENGSECTASRYTTGVHPRNRVVTTNFMMIVYYEQNFFLNGLALESREAQKSIRNETALG